MAEQVAFIVDLGVLAIAALALSLVFIRLKLPVVIGQIIAGMIVGPSVLGLVTDTTVIGDIASVGVVLLLFIIGLELDPLKLSKVLREVILFTGVEVGLAFCFGYVSAVLLHMTFLQSIVFAMTGSITSTAIAGKIFLEKRALQNPVSTFMVGLLIVEDIAAVVFLTVLSSLVTPLGSSGVTTQVAQTVLGGLGLLVFGYLVARYVAPAVIDYLGAYVVESEEVPFLFSLGLGFVFAIFAQYFGYSPGTGAFIIGLAIRGKQSKFLSQQIAPVKDLFLVLFFVAMGSLIDPTPALSLGALIVIALALAVLGKFIGGLVIGISLRKIRPESATQKPRVFGAWLVPRGEFSFVIGQFALTLGVIDSRIFSVIGLTVVATALAGPVIQRLTTSESSSSEHPFKPMADP